MVPTDRESVRPPRPRYGSLADLGVAAAARVSDHNRGDFTAGKVSRDANVALPRDVPEFLKAGGQNHIGTLMASA
jgi:hypothetical protein